MTPAALRYLPSVPPAPVPAPDVVVHNHVRPAQRLGWRGFRAWLDIRSERIEPCPCPWAPQLGVHYRVRRHESAES